MAQGLDVLLAGGQGAIGGAGKGAAIGSMIAPGVGTAIGAGVGALVGGIGAGMKQNTANNSQQIPMVDPMERQRLAQLEQQRKALLAGTDAITQNAIGEVQNVGRATQSAISKNTAGDVSSTMDALLRAQKGTQQGVNQSVMQGRERLPYFDSAAGNLMSRIAQRKLFLERIKSAQDTAQNAQSRTDANVNANAVLGAQGGTQTIPEALKALIAQFQNNQTATATATPTVTQSIPMVGGINPSEENSMFSNDLLQPNLLSTPYIPDMTGLNFR